ncbi:hypothetical protein ACO0LF_25385 [Undibacterium sp. Di27W]|uniref:hypothetical protein n=1 Tax=Undibacterium sp. Di27W TaxID=3413036 RepID=UPI003BF27A24
MSIVTMFALPHFSIPMRVSVFLFACAGLGFASGTQAQNLYRCGSTYQDKPCDNGQAGQIIKKNPSPSLSDKPPLDATCIRRGEEAKKIIWMKEAGAFQDKLIADAKTSEQRKIIADVYAQRGNSNDIRLKIESDCMADKDSDRKLGVRPSDDDLKRQEAAERKASNGDKAKDNTKPDPEDAARLQKLCESSRKKLNAASNSQRTGGTAQEMDILAEHKREIEKMLKEMGCSR